jgi:branched-chain amino acid transport system substrate-binding protein
MANPPGVAQQVLAHLVDGRHRQGLGAKLVSAGNFVPADQAAAVGRQLFGRRIGAAQSYFWGLPGDVNAAFVKSFEERYKRKPTYIDADAYLSFQLVHQAIVKAGTADVGAVRAALAGLKVSTIVGDVEMRAADHQLLRPLIVVQATKAGEGKGEITIRSTLPREEIQPSISPDCEM